MQWGEKMKKTVEIRFAGAGGQGLILASIILSEAAVKNALYATQTQSYGPEARGGMCKADVVIDTDEIDYPKVEKADCLLALTQSAFNKYRLARQARYPSRFMIQRFNDACRHNQAPISASLPQGKKPREASVFLKQNPPVFQP